MSLKTSPKSTPTEKVPDPESPSNDESDIYEIPTSQDIEINPKIFNSHTSKLLSSRLVQVRFYDPDGNLISPAREVHIEAKTLLNEVVQKLQDLLVVNTTATSREFLQAKSIQLRILDHESYQNFLGSKSEVKGGDYEPGHDGKLIWDQLENMDFNWTKSLEILLKNEKNPVKSEHSFLVVQTIPFTEDTSSLPGLVSRTDNESILNSKLETEPNLKRDDREYSEVKLTETLIGMETHNQKEQDKDETNSMKLIDKNKNEPKKKIEYRGNDHILKQIDEKMTTPIGNLNQKSKGVGNLKIREEQEATLPNFFQCQITSPLELCVEGQNRRQANNKICIRNLQLSENMERESNKEQIILSSENTTPCWSDCEEVIEDNELSTQSEYFKNRKDTHKEFRSGRISLRSSRDLEIYRRFHESAISYANEDEEAFFPSTPKSIPEVHIIDETRKTFSEKHQATQLDLDKIVKDAVVRKLNKIRHGYLDPLASPIFNLNEDMIFDQQALYSQGLNQDMSMSQEQIELQQLELLYGYNLCEQGDEFFSKNSPTYFMSPAAKDYGSMLGINPEQNLPSNYGANSLNYIGHNLPYINSTIANYPNNDYNMDNVAGLPYMNPYTMGNPGAYLLNNSHQLGSGNSNFNPTYILRNQMNIPSPPMWNRVHAHGVF